MRCSLRDSHLEVVAVAVGIILVEPQQQGVVVGGFDAVLYWVEVTDGALELGGGVR